MNKYKCIFFDLDHTLWDYETNSQEALQELFYHLALEEKGILNFDNFLFRFKAVNAELWDQYDRGLIDSDVIRKERFREILKSFGVRDEEFSQHLSRAYLSLCPTKANLMPGALETLNYLFAKYDLTIITNGFEEIQHLKLQSGKVDHFFDHVITSQKAGYKKPAKEIFDYALQVNAIEFHEAIMIGDNLMTDMSGARNAWIDTVYFNPNSLAHEHVVKHEIKSLKELCSFL